MLTDVINFFSADGFMPHGHCYLWRPDLVWTMSITNILIGLSYAIISILLFFLIRKVKIPYSPMFAAFSLFIAACGIGHFVQTLTLWMPYYGLAALINLITAVASIATAIYLLLTRKQIVHFTSLEQTNKKQLQELSSVNLELQDKEKHLYLLNKNLNQAYEQERERLAHEIHDQVGQDLTILKMELHQFLEIAKKYIPQEAPKLNLSLQSIDKIAQSLRKISTGLRPVTIDTLGLPAALELLLDEITDRTGVVCTLSGVHEIPRTWSKNKDTALYRIIQEALTNAVKHSKTPEVRVSFEKRADQIRMEVQDFGKKQPSSYFKPKTTGVHGMKQRAYELGARFEIGWTGNTGTRITLEFKEG